MSSQLIVRIDPELKEKVSRLAYREGKTTSLLVRELLAEYVKNRDISGYIDDLWNRTGGKLADAGTTEKDVAEAIRSVRGRGGR
ncbi:MAG TPA: ribbon-helix-helix protein, CopG family [Candidatus Deferrimicrobiaceae bacterium]|jgi:predicted transcriptional regulator